MLAGALSQCRNRRRDPGGTLQGGGRSADLRVAAVGAGALGLLSSSFHHDVVSICRRPQSIWICAVIHRRHALGLISASLLLPSRAFADVAPAAQRDPSGAGPAFHRRGHCRHLCRLQDRRLPDHRQRQGPLGRSQVAGIDLQDSEFTDRAGNRRGRKIPTRMCSSGTASPGHRGLESRSHHAIGDRGLRGAGLSGNRAADRPRADAEICRPVRIRQPQHRRRHRSVLADRRFAHRSGAADRFRRPAAPRRAADLQAKPGSGVATSCRSPRSAMP